MGSPKAASNEVTLEAYQLPANAPGYALLSRSAAAPTQPSCSSDQLCLGGATGRLISGHFVTTEAGTGAVTLNLTSLPQPMGSVPAMAGERWYAQAWHRDAVNGNATSNFKDAAAIEFL